MKPIGPKPTQIPSRLPENAGAPAKGGEVDELAHAPALPPHGGSPRVRDPREPLAQPRTGEAVAASLPAVPGDSVSPATHLARVWLDPAEKARWGAAFRAFWQRANRVLGVPNSELLRALCASAADCPDDVTLPWLLNELKQDVCEPEDEDEQAPRKGNPLRAIAEALPTWEPTAALPVWRGIMDVIDSIRDDEADDEYRPDDVEYSLKQVLPALRHLDDAESRASLLRRAEAIIAHHLEHPDDAAYRTAALGHVATAKARGFVAKKAIPKRTEVLPEADRTLRTKVEIDEALAALRNAPPTTPQKISEAAGRIFVAAAQLRDSHQVTALAAILMETLRDVPSFARAMDRVSHLTRLATPHVRQSFFDTVLAYFIDPASRTDKRQSLTLRALAVSAQPHDLAPLALRTFDTLARGCSGGDTGLMELWSALARQGCLGSLLGEC